MATDDVVQWIEDNIKDEDWKGDSVGGIINTLAALGKLTPQIKGFLDSDDRGAVSGTNKIGDIAKKSIEKDVFERIADIKVVDKGEKEAREEVVRLREELKDKVEKPTGQVLSKIGIKRARLEVLEIRRNRARNLSVEEFARRRWKKAGFADTFDLSPEEASDLYDELDDQARELGLK